MTQLVPIAFGPQVVPVRASLLDQNFNYVSGKWVSVADADYGAQSGGSVDCTAAFQAAANSGARTIYVPDGIWLIAGQVTVPSGVSFVGRSSHATIQSGSGLVTLGAGSIINVTSTTVSPFVYRSGSRFEGLTFYYPNQVRTAITPTVYPATFTYSNANPVEVLTNNSWHNCQFVNSYIWIDALRGHLDFEYYDLIGAPVYRGIRTDGCGGTDIFRYIRGGYYYWCQVTDNAAVWMQSNAIGIEIGRSDAFHMDNIYMGSIKAGIRFFYGTVNTLGGPYGSISGLSFDGTNYGLLCEETHPIGVSVVDMMSNSFLADINIPNGAVSAPVLQLTGFKFWGAPASHVICAQAQAKLRLASGEIYGATSEQILVSAGATHLELIDLYTEGSAPGFRTTASLGSLIVGGCKWSAAPIVNNPAVIGGGDVRYFGNTNLYDRDDRQITYHNGLVGTGGTVNLAKVTVPANLSTGTQISPVVGIENSPPRFRPRWLLRCVRGRL